MIRGLENRSILDLANELDRGGRFVIYPYCVSFLIMTLRLNSSVQYVAPGENRFAKGVPYVFLTILFGWWGIPWGPVFSLASLAETLGGGRDVTSDIYAALQNDPSFQAAREFNATTTRLEHARITAQQFARAATRVVAYGIAANSEAGQREMAFATRICWDLFGEVLEQQELDSILRLDSQESNWSFVLPQVCKDVKDMTTIEERRILLSLVAKLMLADGKFTAQEKAYFSTAGKHLGLDRDDIRLVFETEKHQFLQSDASTSMKVRKARAILSISDDASQEEIKKRYRKLALKYHPDRVGHLGPKVQAEAQRNFKKITEARDVLLGS